MIQIDDYDMRRILRAVRAEILEEKKGPVAAGLSERKEKSNNEILSQKTAEEVNS